MVSPQSASLQRMVEDSIPVEKLTLETKNCAITTRVSRLWDAYNAKSKKDLISTDMVLIDREGSYIHASIKGNFAHMFRKVLAEGSVYYIKNFSVVENKPLYRVVGDNKLMIQLYANSVVRPVGEESLGLSISGIPMHRFDLLDFDKVESRMRQEYVLTDVVGQVCCEGEVIEKNSHGKPVPSLMLELVDLRNVKIRLTLWDKSIDDYMNQKSLLKNGIVVGVFTSNMVKQYMNNAVLSTTSASKVYLDLDIDEVLALKKKGSASPTENIIQPLYTQEKNDDKDTVLSGLKTIGELLQITASDFTNGALFYCVATIFDIHNNNGWYYNSCACKGIIKAYIGGFWCKKCNKTVADAIPRLRIELGVKDDTESTKFIVFDDVAEKMIGQSAISVYDMQEKLEESEDCVGEVPAIIGNLIGQRFVFRVKLTEYNRTAYRQSFTANKILEESILESTSNKERNDPLFKGKDDEPSSQTPSKKKAFKYGECLRPWRITRQIR